MSLIRVTQRPAGERQLDMRLTAKARKQHATGTERLNEAFGLAIRHDDAGNLLPPPPAVFDALVRSCEFGEPGGRGRPVRLKPGTPPVRDAEHQAKHEKRKRAHESRRRNR